MGEAPIVVGEELRQEGVGGLARGDAAQAEADDQAILQGAPQPFDAAFGLRRAGGDVADAEVVQQAAEVGRVLRALEFLFEAPVRIVADEDVEASPYKASGSPWAMPSWCSRVT